MIAARLAIADHPGRPLASLTDEDRARIGALPGDSPDRRTIIARVRGYFREQAKK